MKLGPVHLVRDATWQRLRTESQAAVAATPPPSPLAMLQAVDDWTTRFTVDGVEVGGYANLYDDWRLLWLLDAVGGPGGKRVLELGHFEGAHSKTMLDRGAREVIGIEGLQAAWIRSLVVKEAFDLKAARFLYGDFCAYVSSYDGEPFDFVLASGVLYHQRNPVALIEQLSRLTERVLVWSQVADDTSPEGPETVVESGAGTYLGRTHDYGDTRAMDRGYCGGIAPTSVWLYADDLLRAFADAGFTSFSQHADHRSVHGAAVLFAASKHDDLNHPDWQFDVAAG